MSRVDIAPNERFQIERVRDIVTCSEVVSRAVSSGERLSAEEICLLTGLEAYLAPNLARCIQNLRRARRTSIRVVLLAQM